MGAASTLPPLPCGKGLSDSFEVAIVGVACANGANVVVTIIQFFQRFGSGIWGYGARDAWRSIHIAVQAGIEARLAGHARSDPPCSDARLGVPFHESNVGSNGQNIRTLISSWISVVNELLVRNCLLDAVLEFEFPFEAVPSGASSRGCSRNRLWAMESPAPHEYQLRSRCLHARRNVQAVPVVLASLGQRGTPARAPLQDRVASLLQGPWRLSGLAPRIASPEGCQCRACWLPLRRRRYWPVAVAAARHPSAVAPSRWCQRPSIVPAHSVQALD